MTKVILVSGAGRGLGADIAREALAAGHQVVATGRRPDELAKTLRGPQDNLLAIRLDVTSVDASTAASRFAVEGWMEALRYDVAPYDVHTTVVEPGFFRTELLGADSTTWPELSIADYAPRTAPTIEGWKAMSGQQPGDPAKLARALL